MKQILQPIIMWSTLVGRSSLRCVAFRGPHLSRQLFSAQREHSLVKSVNSIDTNRVSGYTLAYVYPNNSPGRSALFSSSSTTDDGAVVTEDDNDTGFYADTGLTFGSIGVKSPVLLELLAESKILRPSAVQASAFDPILSGTDVVVGAETGSGKTLAYLLPLVDDVLCQKSGAEDGKTDYDYCRAVILVPNKELAQQVLRMAVEIGGRIVDATGGAEPVDDNRNEVRFAVLPGGLETPQSFRPFREDGTGVDIVVCTPAALGQFGASPKNIDLFADVRTLIIDEADMLLDGGYLRQLETVLMGFRRADKLAHTTTVDADTNDFNDSSSFAVRKTQHVFVGATLPDYGLKSVDAYIQKKFPYVTRVAMPGLHNARHYGLKDDTRTSWLEQEYGDNNRERMETLVELLKSTSEEDGDSLRGDKVMVFLNTVEDVDGATNGMRRAGLNAIPYHAKIPLVDRVDNLERFRKYVASGSSANEEDNDMPILVCTDLASRGLDIPGVTAVVQLQFAGNVVAHLHRMGRCGRAGKRDGRGIIFYGPAEKELVSVVREAETQQERMTLKGDVMSSEEEEGDDDVGKVKNAFSRKRGFTKKRKKERRDKY